VAEAIGAGQAGGMEPAPTPPPLRLGLAEEADVPAVVALVESAYRGEGSRRGWTTEADYLDGQRVDEAMVRAMLRQRGSLVLVARQGERLVGCCRLEDLGGGVAELGMLAVDPLAQGQGVGRALLAEGARVAAERLGARRLRLLVLWMRDELIAWYERRGFRPTGERRPFPYGDLRYGLPRRPDLWFSVLERPLP
jgi:ribosomal protein S18 acetylase RimI-like enzyme